MPERGAPLSLKQRLWAWLMLPLLLGLGLLGLSLHLLMTRAHRDWLDDSLADTALALASLITERDGRLQLDFSADTDRALRFDRQDRIYYAALGPEQLLLRGDEALAQLDLPVPSPTEPWLFVDAQLAGVPVRVAQLSRPCPNGNLCELRVAQTLSKRDAVARELWGLLLLSLLSLAALLVLASWWAIRQGLQPLQQLGQQLEQRGLDRLQPLDARLPAELQGLKGAFDRLFARLREASQAQQAFLADAAHQLRTPLTTLRTEIDLALLEPHDAQTEPLLLRLQRAVGRSARLAQQMLAMARADAPADDERRLLDLGDLARQLAEDGVAEALRQGIDFGFELEPAPVHGVPHLLRELLENLVHNAITYATSHARGDTRVTVRSGSHAAAARAWLEVEDNGPGIPVALREQALQRFRRLDPSHGSGSGLGLAIAQDIAQRHGGQLALLDPQDGGSGLRVRVSLPLGLPDADGSSRPAAHAGPRPRP